MQSSLSPLVVHILSRAESFSSSNDDSGDARGVSGAQQHTNDCALFMLVSIFLLLFGEDRCLIVQKKQASGRVRCTIAHSNAPIIVLPRHCKFPVCLYCFALFVVTLSVNDPSDACSSMLFALTFKLFTYRQELLLSFCSLRSRKRFEFGYTIH